jgi:hypothetical protein
MNSPLEVLSSLMGSRVSERWRVMGSPASVDAFAAV